MTREALRRLPLLRELFAQWRDNRGALPPGASKVAFSRDWETLLEAAALITAEQRREALRDADALEADGWVKTTRDRSRRYQIKRISIPLTAEPRLRNLFVDELPAFATPLDLTAIAWAPELAFIPADRVQVASEDLLKLNEFFQTGRRDRLSVPVKERSLQIFGDEKRLDALRATTLFRDDRLTLKHLCCFVAAEPLGWQRGPGLGTSAPVLVLENAATFDSFARWNENAGEFSAVVYGGGNRFVDSVARLVDIFRELRGIRPVRYFGDLDPAGLRIPCRAAARAERLGLPAIEPDLRSYGWLLAHGSPAAPDAAEEDPKSSVEDASWLGELAPAVTALFASGRRLVQEHIGWEFLVREGR